MRLSSRLRHLALAMAAITAFLAVPATTALADADDDSDRTTEQIDQVFDVVVLRPLDAAALLCGGVLMVPATILGAIGGKEVVQDSWDLLILTSWENLVDRPIGQWGS